MSLLVVDGFDYYDDEQDVNRATSGSGATASVVITGGKLRLTAGNSSFDAADYTLTLPSSDATIIVGMGWNQSSQPGGTGGIGYWEPFQFREGATKHVLVRVSNAGRLYFTNGSGTTLAESYIIMPTTDTTGQRYVELKVNIHDTTGTVEARLDGEVIASASALDTRNGGTGVIDTLYFATGRWDYGSSKWWEIDDLYVCDDAGSTNNDFLGECGTEVVFPNAEGNYSAWTPSTGTDNSALVDENPHNSDTDYVSASSAATKDTYTHAGMAATAGTVYGVAVNMAARDDAAGSQVLKSIMRLSSTDANGAQHTQSGSYEIWQSIHEAKPGTGSWTITDVNNAEFGQEVHS